MKIYLTRHGETDWNKQSLIQGLTDNALNQIGIEQAQELEKFFAPIDIDLVVASSLERAMTTAEIATKRQPDIIDDQFIERNFGDFEGCEVKTFFNHSDPNLVPDFENDETIKGRVQNGLKTYANSNFETIAIFTHSHVLKAALSSIAPEQYNFSSYIKNCAIVELDYTNNQWQIIDIH